MVCIHEEILPRGQRGLVQHWIIYDCASYRLRLESGGQRSQPGKRHAPSEQYENVALLATLSGIGLNTTPRDRRPLKKLQLMRFDGTNWVPFGGLYGNKERMGRHAFLDLC